jgi:hypothetical protein
MRNLAVHTEKFSYVVRQTSSHTRISYVGLALTSSGYTSLARSFRRAFFVFTFTRVAPKHKTPRPKHTPTDPDPFLILSRAALRRHIKFVRRPSSSFRCLRFQSSCARCSIFTKYQARVSRS